MNGVQNFNSSGSGAVDGFKRRLEWQRNHPKEFGEFQSKMNDQGNGFQTLLIYDPFEETSSNQGGKITIGDPSESQGTKISGKITIGDPSENQRTKLGEKITIGDPSENQRTKNIAENKLNINA